MGSEKKGFEKQRKELETNIAKLYEDKRALMKELKEAKEINRGLSKGKIGSERSIKADGGEISPSWKKQFADFKNYL